MLTPEQPTSLRLRHSMLRTRVASFAATPAIYQSLAAKHPRLLDQSSIMSMTQAGGRLADDLVLRHGRHLPPHQHRRG